MPDADDPLARLRSVLAAQHAHLERHGVLYDAPGVDLDDLEWAIAEIERPRFDREEARRTGTRSGWPVR